MQNIEHNSGGLLPILAVEMQDNSDGLVGTSASEVRSKSSSVLGRHFNADGRVADFKNAEEVMNLFYGP